MRRCQEPASNGANSRRADDQKRCTVAVVACSAVTSSGVDLHWSLLLVPWLSRPLRFGLHGLAWPQALPGIREDGRHGRRRRTHICPPDRNFIWIRGALMFATLHPLIPTGNRAH